jgi:hypothetical protein
MIVHHRAGEFVSGAMNRQYRPMFNFGVPLTTMTAGVFTGAYLWDGLLALIPAAGLLFTYGVNLKGRKNRIHPYALKKPNALTESWVLELQDIYFHIPPEHKEAVAGLLEGAYRQIEIGNIDLVNPRLEKARALQKVIVRLNEELDTREDMLAVDSHVRAMQRALEA